MRKQKIFRIKPYFKNLISHESIDKNINNSDLVNEILSDFNFNRLNIKEMVNEPKLSKDNVQVVYRLDEMNINRFETFAQQYDLKYSIVLNHIFEIYFSGNSK